MKAEMIFEAIDKASSVIRGIAGATKKLAALSGKGFALVDAGARKVGKGLLAATAIATGFAASVVALSRKLLGPTREFEKFQAVLETTEGSAKKAKAALSWAETFAAKTPYELNEVTEAYVKLRAYGLDPTNGLLKSLGDTASAMDKPIMQAVEAIADAVTGENERLKEFGIKARAQGKYFLYEYTENGVTKVAKALKTDRAAIETTLRGIFDTKYAGAMERQSNTWDGIVSNLMDFWTKFQRLIMDSGPFDYLKTRLKEVLALVEDAFKTGKAQAIAEEIGKAIVSTFKWIETTVRAAIPIVLAVVEALGKVSDFVGGWDRLAMIIAAVPFAKVFVGAAVGVMQMAAGLAMIAASPVGWVLGAAAAAAYLLIDDWGAAFDWLKTTAMAAWETVASAAREVWTGTKAFFSDLWAAITPEGGWVAAITAGWGKVKAAWAGAKAFFSDLWAAITPEGGWEAAITAGWGKVKAAWAGAKAFFADIWASITPEAGWTATLTDAWETVKAAWGGAKALFSDVAAGFSSHLEPIGNKLSALAERFGRMGDTLASIVSRIASAFEGKGGEGLSKAAKFLGSLAGLSLDVLVATLDLAAAGIETLLNALDEFLAWALDGKPIDWSRILPDIDWPEIPDSFVAGFEKAFATVTRVVEKAWALIGGIFDEITDAARALASTIGETVGKALDLAGKAWDALSGPKGGERFLAEMEEIASGSWLPGGDEKFVEGLALTEALQAGQVGLDTYRDKLAAIVAEGGKFAGQAERMLDASRKLDTLQDGKAPQTATLPEPADLEAISARIAAIDAAAQALPATMRSVVAEVRVILDGVNFSHQGQRMMETLAAGIRSRAALVTDAIRTVTQQVRDHLPSSPAKVGPLSDLHKLKFGETIARSIKAEPMVAAMRRAALATLAAATPLAGASMQPALAGTEAPAPVSIAALGARAASQSGPGQGAAAGQPVSITYAPSVTIEGGSPADAARFEALLREHGDELARIVEDVIARNRRLDF